MRRKICGVLLFIGMLFFLFPTSAKAISTDEIFSKDGLFYLVTELPKGKNPGRVTVTPRYDSLAEKYIPYTKSSYTIPEQVTCDGMVFTVTEINSNTFNNSTNLTSVEIPNSVEYIYSSAFQGCTALPSIKLPDNVKFTTLYFSTFGGCSSLTSIEIPSSIKIIEKSAFEKCKSLKNVTLNQGLEEIGNKAFMECNTLRTVEIPGSVTKIGDSAFQECTNLKNIFLDSGVKTIGKFAFYNCKSLTAVEIPDSVTSIDSYAFRGCTNLKDVWLPTGISLGDDVFPTNTKLHYYTNKLDPVNASSMKWEDTKATWEAVPGAQDYMVQLYWNGQPVGEPVYADYTQSGNSQVADTVYTSKGFRPEIVAKDHGSYTFTVKAMGSRRQELNNTGIEESGYLNATWSAKSPQYVFTALDEPAYLYWDDTKAVWTPVANAQDYLVQLYKDGKALETVYADYTPSGDPLVADTINSNVSFYQQIKANGPGKYTFSVSARASRRTGLNDGIVMKPGTGAPYYYHSLMTKVSSPCDYPKLIDYPRGLSWEDSKAVWTVSANAQDYLVQLYKDGEKLGDPVYADYTPSKDPNVADTIHTEVSFYIPIKRNGPGEYTFTVQALAERRNGINDGIVMNPAPGAPVYLDSLWTFITFGELYSPSPLAKPSGLSWEDSKALWTGTANAEDYLVQLYKDGEKLGDPVYADYTPSEDPSLADIINTEKSFQQQQEENGSGVYSFSVRALANRRTGLNDGISLQEKPEGPVYADGAWSDLSQAYNYTKPENTHIHQWLTEWEHNDTHHWHNCGAADCPLTDIAQKANYAEHIYENDTDTLCSICGYTRESAPLFIPVTWIIFNGSPTTAINTALPLSAYAVPSNATNKTITWTLTDPAGTGAAINSNTFQAATPGTAIVTATIANGTAQGKAYSQIFNITVTETAAALYQVQVDDGLGGGNYEEGAEVTITAAAPPSGKRFKAWTGCDTLTFISGDENTETIKFLMPASDVPIILSATYEDIPVELTHSIILDPASDKEFPEANEGYEAQQPYSMSIQSTGTGASGALMIALTGKNPDAFTLSTESIDSINSGETGSFTITPVTGLTKGTYQATVTVSSAVDSDYAVVPQSIQVTFTVNETPACIHEHTELHDSLEATCTTDGYTGNTYCTDCGILLAEGIKTDALGHKYSSKVTKEPTTTQEGIRTYTCDRCGNTYTEEIAKKISTANGTTVQNPPSVTTTTNRTAMTTGSKTNTTVKEAPETGDNSNPILCILLLIISTGTITIHKKLIPSKIHPKK